MNNMNYMKLLEFLHDNGYQYIARDENEALRASAYKKKPIRRECINSTFYEVPEEGYQMYPFPLEDDFDLLPRGRCIEIKQLLTSYSDEKTTAEEKIEEYLNATMMNKCWELIKGVIDERIKSAGPDNKMLINASTQLSKVIEVGETYLNDLEGAIYKMANKGRM